MSDQADELTVQLPDGVVVLRRGAVDAADPASTEVQPTLKVGSGGKLAGRRRVDPRVRFDDVLERAQRLVQWAGEESRYLRTHDVSLFSSEDVRGRDGFADEGLYDLLPRLLEDAATLRFHCGRGVMWDEIRAATRTASEAVQDYYLLWQTMRRPPNG